MNFPPKRRWKAESEEEKISHGGSQLNGFLGNALLLLGNFPKLSAIYKHAQDLGSEYTIQKKGMMQPSISDFNLREPQLEIARHTFAG